MKNLIYCRTEDLILQMVIMSLENSKQGQLNFLDLILVVLYRMDWRRTKLKAGIAENIFCR